MKYYLFFLIPLITIVTIVAISILRFRNKKLYKNKRNKALLIANTKHIRNLPEYKLAKKRYNLLLTAAAGLFLIFISSLTILASRPVKVDSVKTDLVNHDIMLCLDVSNSMQPSLEKVLEYYADFTTKMKGQRIGVTIFNSGYSVITPLSDDYDAMSELLDDMSDNIEEYSEIPLSSNAPASSVGPGLAGCVSAFDNLSVTERSRSIVLVTDNEAPFSQAFNIKQAALYAKTYNIAVYGLDTKANSTTVESKISKEFREATSLSGGSYYNFNTNQQNSIDEISSQISEQESARLEGAGKLVTRDDPKIYAIVTLVVLLLFIILTWRLKL